MAQSQTKITSALGLEPTSKEIPIPGERRAEFRRTVEMSAVCEFNDSQDRIDCSVVDITNSGAQLAVPSADAVPESFKLYVLPLNTILDCRVKWRKQDRLGVSFSTLSDSVV